MLCVAIKDTSIHTNDAMLKGQNNVITVPANICSTAFPPLIVGGFDCSYNLIESLTSLHSESRPWHKTDGLSDPSHPGFNGPPRTDVGVRQTQTWATPQCRGSCTYPTLISGYLEVHMHRFNLKC